MHLDTVCTMVDRDAVVMYPLLADTLVAFTTTPGVDGATEVAGPEPFLLAAARAMEIDRLRVIDTGLDPVTAEREQWDDGNNTLALAPGLRRRLRAQHRDQPAARGRGHRGRAGSPAQSWVRAAAVRAACPVPSSATPWTAERAGPRAGRAGAARRGGRRGPRRRAGPLRAARSQAPARARRRRAAGRGHHAAHGRRGPVVLARAAARGRGRPSPAPGTATSRASRCTGRRSPTRPRCWPLARPGGVARRLARRAQVGARRARPLRPRAGVGRARGP